MLSKFFVFVTVFNFVFGTSFQTPRDDVVILNSGERITGKINWVSDEVVNIETGSGEKTIVRKLHVDAPRDIVESGVLRTKRHSGFVHYFNEDYIEIKTATGKLRLKRTLVKKIILSQEPSFRL